MNGGDVRFWVKCGIRPLRGQKHHPLLWMNEILHHFETMGSHCWLVFTGESFIPGFLEWCEMDFVHPQYEVHWAQPSGGPGARAELCRRLRRAGRPHAAGGRGRGRGRGHRGLGAEAAGGSAQLLRLAWEVAGCVEPKPAAGRCVSGRRPIDLQKSTVKEREKKLRLTR